MTEHDSESEKHKELRARDAKYLVRPWSSGKGVPHFFSKAKNCVVTDPDGREFIDFTAGYFVNNAGHCHEKITGAASEQMKKVTQVSGKHATEAAIDLAEAIVTRSPKSIDKIFFTTGGSESNENAMKMARQKTGKKHIAYLKNAYHGLTVGALSACASEKYRDSAGIPVQQYSYEVSNAYCYRCPHAQNCETQCLDETEKKFDEHPDTAAIIAEPVQAVGGLAAPQKWWDRLEEMRKKRGILLILDEVQTGLGRTGKMFGAEHYGLEPEILTAGKGLSGGIGSLAATCGSDDVTKDYFGGTTPTSAGNAVSAAAGLALINVIEDEGLLENCRKAGELLTSEIAALDDPWVGDIRFTGLLGGVELVKDRESKEPLEKATMGQINGGLYDEGMLVTISGPLGNCVRIQPPLSISADQVKAFAQAFGRVLKKVRSQG